LPKYQIIDRNQYTFVMLNYLPLKDGHLMVLPNRHVTQLSDLKPIESVNILKYLEIAGKVIKKLFSQDPIIIMNTGSHSTQDHLHFHILPSKGGIRELFQSFEKVPYRRKASKQELINIAQKIKTIWRKKN
jgi:diadenosine tetraphosphate (Ap4A) HIT family hydrolase